ncbi:hypothetical protein [Mycobacterium arosiense]|uniref:Scaffolding protein n=1 Tax=Mycobacterium arosiense ATCC BAA-1401 = DSM 45069 TaxID=1265311 RepID=A0A1W9Z503_MYCAI|nr:hypothetical protein [Mycobacterium arosiense]ORA07421.1 hypothetical protein BST14_27775 [Mycobacterium arosiense ATCC BAA-1401 = DSM 45069]
MTDTQTHAAGAESPADAQTVPGQGIDAGEPESGSESPNGSREARFRKERNEARTALAEAQARIEAYQRREVERLAADLAQPGDLLELGGVSLADLLGEDGEVDPEAVAEAVAALVESRPGLAKNPRQRAVDPSQGLGGQSGKASPTWGDLLR